MSPGTPAPLQPRPPRSAWYNLGAFFGHIGRAIVADTPKPGPTATAKRVSTQEQPTQSPIPGTRATLRRTTTDEVIIEPLEPRTNP
ncbi:MAG: hypothetical protein ACKVS8_09950 [Phycisphaerales bacterium]